MNQECLAALTYKCLYLPCLNVQMRFENCIYGIHWILLQCFFLFWSLMGGFHCMEKSHHVNILPLNLLRWPCNVTICVLQSLLSMICKFSRASWPEPVRPVTWETAFITDSDYFTCSRFMFAGSFFCKSAGDSDMIHTSAHLLLALTWSINSY